MRFADGHLIRSGKIPSKNLYAQRKGEYVFDKKKVKMVPLESDMIKIKVRDETLECIFLDEDKRCKQYASRPVECRAFKCWDTLEIESKYQEDPLTRKDLLSDVEGLWEIIEDHQKRCSYAEVKSIIDKMDKDNPKIEALSDIIKYDISLRKTLVEKGGVEEDILDFLLGRPLTVTIRMFDYSIEEKDGKRILKKVTNA